MNFAYSLRFSAAPFAVPGLPVTTQRLTMTFVRSSFPCKRYIFRK